MSSTGGSPQVPIAIVGLACRFPGDATSPSKLWDLLKEGRDAYSPRTDRWNPDAFYHPNSSRLGTIPTKGGHFLKQDPYVFDAAFFNITATEALALDPKQRIAMEVAYEALENAGMPLRKVAGSQTACFMGSAMADYRDSMTRDFGFAPKYQILGTSEEMVSNRISHFLDIHGPSATIHTACSSSLVATHIACQSIRSGEADMAIAGGVGIILTPDSSMQLNNLSFLNPEGHSRSFDANAGGYARGEGCGILVLKRLDRAIEDGDSIRAVIRASGVNSDGWTQGVTMPSKEAQAALIKSVFESNELDYGSIQYVEAHGTGTKAGDPVETSAIHMTIGQGASKTRKLWVGSLKPNIGHLEAAAGVAGIIKGVLALENNSIPPNIYFSEPNPEIHFEDWNMAVPTKLTPWPVSQTKRMTVSGFGMGGTNGLVVLEGYDPQRPPQTLIVGSQPKRSIPRMKKRVFFCSSQDQAGIKRFGDSVANHLDSLGPTASMPEYMANLAHTLSVAKSELSWRAAFVADSAAELQDKLANNPGENARRADRQEPPRIGFVFTGQGAQWANMGVELLEKPVFSDSVSLSAQFLQEMDCDWDPVTELSRPQNESRLGNPEISQPICTVLQIALVEELKSWGVLPSKVVGHSSGEIAAAYSIGALTHRDAIAIAYYRGRASAGLKSSASHLKGGMMAVGASVDEAERFISENQLKLDGIVTVACVNSPASVTLSGDIAALETLRVILDERKIFARRLKVDVAYHSSHMNLAASEYSTSIADIEPRQTFEDDTTNPQIMVSSVTVQEVAPELLGPYYWIRNLVSPVLFSDALLELVSPTGTDEVTVDVLIEIGPHSALGGPIEQVLNKKGIQNVVYKSVLTRGQSSIDTSLKLAVELFLEGVTLNAQNINGDLACRLLLDLPPYPWNHSKVFRADSRLQRELLNRQFPTRSLIGSKLPMMDESQHIWRNYIRLTDEPWLRGHVVGGTALVPGAGMVSMVLEATQQLVEAGKTARSIKLRDVSFSAAFTLPEDTAIETVITIRPHLVGTSGNTPASWWEFTVSSCLGSDQLRDNCRGLVAIEYNESRSDWMICEDEKYTAAKIADYHQVRRQCTKECSKEGFYDHMKKSGYGYGGHFNGMEKIYLGDGQTAFEVKLSDIGETFSKGQTERPFLIHGAALDSIFQSIFGSTFKNGGFEVTKPNFLTYIGDLEILLDLPSEVGYTIPGVCFSQQHGFSQRSADMAIFDSSVTRVFMSVSDFRMAEADADFEDTSKQDKAAFSSVPRWNWALSLMRPDEVVRVLEGFPPEYSTVELVRMLLHDNPSASVVELVSRSEDISDTITSRLPKGTSQPSQQSYAITGVIPHGSSQDNLFGEVFELGENGTALPAERIASADLLVISNISEGNQVHDEMLERFMTLAKPNAMLVTAPGAHIGSSVLESRGLQSLISRGSTKEIPNLFTSSARKSIGLTNGAYSDKTTTPMIILEPTISNVESTAFASALRDVLREQGYSVSLLNWDQLASEDQFNGKTYISLLELEQPLLDNLSEPDFLKIKALVLNCGRLLWVTRGENPSFNLVDGFSRVMRNELGSGKFKVLHLSADTGAEHGATLAERILDSATEDTEFREESGSLQVTRIFNYFEGNESIRQHLESSMHPLALDQLDHPVRLTIGKPGLLDTLQFIKQDFSQTTLADTEVEIEVKATGINFRDVMASMGLISTPILGFEASGIVVQTGGSTSHMKPGTRVSVLGEHTHGTRIRVDSRLTTPIPDDMSFEEAAALPIVGTTAYHALINLGRLRKGQSVLVHAAAGGVGQAVIQLAMHLGLTVYATVGTDDKRKLLIERYNMPEENIFYSRDASFVKSIKRATNGRGVDCVLNSLSGELLRASWGCVAKFGTFIELGLRDITNNMRLDMRPFSNVTTFCFCNILALMQEQPSFMGDILHETFKLVQQKVFTASSPITVYQAGEVQEAFRTMQQGKHRGKLVLSFSGETHIPFLQDAKDSLQLDPSATYLIVGGLGGLGRSFARELVASGARNLAFMSRSGDKTPAARAVLKDLRSQNVRVCAYAVDVADEDCLNEAMEKCSNDLPPIKGVIQMAMVLRDVIFEKMSYDAWTQPLQPKVRGTWNLHRYFDHSRPLDFFIICSSNSGIHGYPSQAQYAAGNTYQDALAHSRRKSGLKAVAVNLAIMREVGILAEQGMTGNIAIWEEALGIGESAFHALMKSLISGQQGPTELQQIPPQISTGLGTADTMAAHGLALPGYFTDPRFGPLSVPSVRSGTTADGRHAAVSIASKLVEAGNTEEATDIVIEALVTKIAEILQMPASEVDPSRPMYRYGVDSLVALEVRNWITREMQANIALLEILAAVPMKDFAKTIAERSKHTSS
ncbi:reducing polyketide synthase [Pyrenochaeta sp. MPI-SDFR-AT-0127]|nr:reducing polyketide synthase [Pyrenochaeta sp. MPI-SDFR-AT-0127]